MLDVLRARLPSLRTSMVLGYMSEPNALLALLGLSPESIAVNGIPPAAIMAAAMIAIQDEVDRRFPVADPLSDPPHRLEGAT